MTIYCDNEITDIYCDGYISEVHYGLGKTNCLTSVPNNIDLQLDPLNVTVVGTPTNSNGIVNGFSTSNYLLTTNSVNLNSVNSWEIVLRAQHNSGSLLQQHSNSPYTIALQCGMMLVNLTGSAWTVVYEADNGLVEGNWYYIRASFNGTTYKFERAEDGGEYVVLGTLENSSKIVSNEQPFIIGINDVHTDPFLGSIDLPESYIKINDELWWKGGTGQVILKKGSKIYIPNGFEEDGTTKKFDEVVTDKDYTYTVPTSSNTYFVYLNKNYVPRFASTNYSGDTQPTTSANYATWYDTKNNLIKLTNDVGANWNAGLWALPICICKATANIEIYEIPQIFDWCGYIGSTAFMLPNVKGLIPNGWNEDETYKSIEFETSNVLITNTPQVAGNFDVYLADNVVALTATTAYNSSTNINYDTVAGSQVLGMKGCSLVTDSSGTITSLTPYEVKTINDTKVIYTKSS